MIFIFQKTFKFFQQRNPYFWSFLLTSAFLLALSLPAHSLLVKPVSLDTIKTKATLIFSGEVIETETDLDSQNSGYKVVYTYFRVDECLKGACNEPTLVIKQVAKLTPSYGVGQSYLLFLGYQPKNGIYAPIGIHQGVFPIQTKGELKVIPKLKKLSQKQIKALATSVQKNKNLYHYADFREWILTSPSADSTN